MALARGPGWFVVPPEIEGTARVPLLRGASTEGLPAVEVAVDGRAALARVDVAGDRTRIGLAEAGALGLRWRSTQVRGFWTERTILPEVTVGDAVLRDVRAEVVREGPLVLSLASLGVPARLSASEGVVEIGGIDVSGPTPTVQEPKVWWEHGAVRVGTGLAWTVSLDDRDVVPLTAVFPTPDDRADPRGVAFVGYEDLVYFDVSVAPGVLALSPVAVPQWTDSHDVSVAIARQRDRERELAEVLWLEGSWNEALVLLAGQAEDSEGCLDHFRLGMRRLANGEDGRADLERAAELWEDFASLTPLQRRHASQPWRCARARAAVMSLDRLEGQTVRVAEAFDAHLDLEPAVAWAWGMHLLERGAWRDAEAMLRRAVHLGADDTETRLALAFALAGQGRHEAARTLAVRLRPTRVSHVRALQRLGQRLDLDLVGELDADDPIVRAARGEDVRALRPGHREIDPQARWPARLVPEELRLRHPLTFVDVMIPAFPEP